ncbi:hypothetical protein MKX01_006160 [Papaver californicum]|nr:hypothetical protein MKX01_006160 [Papaver californicum]
MGRTIQVYGFHSYVNAEMVKEFLENYTGKGTVYALVIPKSKNKGPNPRVFANVQFINKQHAEIVSSLINRRLYYGNSYLKPRVSMFHLQAPALHFGCQVSDDCFHVIWKGLDVTVDFEFRFRKLSFLLYDCDVHYKLELSYESIWRIHLHRPKNRSTQRLLIQMFAAPKVYKRNVSSSDAACADSILQYCKDTFDDKCVRTTDFTQSCSIGQSSAMCLELPYDCDLPDFCENFPYYKEDKRCFTLQSDSTFSQCSDLLPFEILFKVSSLVQYGCLSGPTLDTTSFRMVDPRFTPAGHIERALEKLYHLRECCYEPVKWLNEQYSRYRSGMKYHRSPAISLDGGMVYVRGIQVTPSKVYFCGPEVNVSNRVLRHYHEHIDNFIRISFVDENWEKILIGDKKFDFLAFSSSQLRNNSAWMFASVGTVTASRIREWMGDIREIRNVAKYAARLGQSFGSSTETLNVYTHEIELIPDIDIERNETKYTFSDGIGKISSEFAREVASKCGLEGFTPTAFQIRYGGYKGVVVVDPTSKKKLSLRDSMCKFKSQNTKLDVLAWSKYQPCFLDRQVISLLSTLGVSDAQLDLSLTDPLRAYEALEIMSPGESTNILKEMLLCGCELRTRTRIFVPRGRSMIGCLDESRILDYGQEVIQYFADYMISDSLGIIANTHVAFADKEPHMAESDQCIELAKLFSIAVDFPKTGAPAEIPPHLRVDTYPDFMEKLHKVKDTAPNMSCVKSFTLEVAKNSYDHDMEFHGFEKHLDDAEYYKGEYDFKLGNLLDYYGIKTEAAIFGGGILEVSKSFSMRKDAGAISLGLRSLRKEARAWFNESRTCSVNEAVNDLYAKASAWYHVTYHPSYWGRYNDGMNRAHYLSFPWCVYDKLIHIKRMSSMLQ